MARTAGRDPLFPIAGLALAVLAALSFAPALLNDGDTSWHIAAGSLILDSGAVPKADPFSFTFAGAPWTAHEWLAEILMAGAWRLGSWAGVALLAAGAAAALLLIIGLEARRRLPPLPAVLAVLAVLVILAPFAVARPHVLAWPILAAWTLLLLDARDRGRAPPLAAALLMLAWANLHGSFLLGLALIAPFALEAAVEAKDRVRAAAAWGIFGLVSLAAALLTPHGVHGLLFPVAVSGMESLPLIAEWRPTILSRFPGFAAVLLATLFLLVRGRIAVPPLRLLLLLGLLYLSLEHVRHQAVLAIIGSLVLLRAIPADETRRRVPLAAIAALLALAAAIAAARLALPMEQPDSASNPVTAIRHVPDGLRERPVLNSYAFGGPLILAGIRPYIDGRADMYGDSFLFGHQRMVEGDLAAFRAEAERRGIEWTMLAPHQGLVRQLDQDPGWRRVYADPWAVIHVRSP